MTTKGLKCCYEQPTLCARSGFPQCRWFLRSAAAKQPQRGECGDTEPVFASTVFSNPSALNNLTKHSNVSIRRLPRVKAPFMICGRLQQLLMSFPKR